MSQDHVQRKLAAILAADVVGYSRMVGSDEVGTIARLKALRADPIDPVIARYRGRIVKEIGDGFLAEFASIVDAVQCAADIQAALAVRASGETGEPIRFRIGVNLGDVLVEGDDLLGDGVNVAARLEGLAEPGGVCISGNAHEQVRQRLDLAFEDMGPQSLKNIATPVRAFRLRPGGTVSKPAAKMTRRRMAVALGVLLVALLVVGGGLAWWQTHKQGAATSAPEIAATTLPVKSERRLKIAVLPFETTGSSPDDTWLGNGIAEDIMIELSRFRDIGVIARNSSFRFGSEPTDMAALREELGADFVLRGSARLHDDQMRLTLQLIDTANATNIWAERYDRPFDDVFSVRADIINQIAARLVDEAYDATSARLAAGEPGNLDAFEQVMRARWHYYRFTGDDAIKALAMAERAVEIDPGYAAAWDMLSRVLFQFYVQPYDERRGDPATLERGIAAAQKAVALDPRNSTAIATPWRCTYLGRSARVGPAGTAACDRAQSQQRHGRRQLRRCAFTRRPPGTGAGSLGRERAPGSAGPPDQQVPDGPFAHPPR